MLVDWLCTIDPPPPMLLFPPFDYESCGECILSCSFDLHPDILDARRLDGCFEAFSELKCLLLPLCWMDDEEVACVSV